MYGGVDFEPSPGPGSLRKQRHLRGGNGVEHGLERELLQPGFPGVNLGSPRFYLGLIP